MLLLATLLFQTTDAAILGRITDTASSPIAAATVTARNSATGLTWSVLTNSSGRYAFLELPLGGPYSITATRVGYRPETRLGYTLHLGIRSVVDIALVPAPVELPEITATGAENEARRSTLGGTFRIGDTVIAKIPAVNRNFTDLAALAPTAGPQLSFLGQRWTSTDIRIDGLQARNMLRAGELGAGPFTLSLEAIREFEMSATVFDVTQSRQGGGSIRAATKSGTNAWTGSVFAYYKGEGLSAATDYQGKSRETREFNALQWGGSLGGPIARNKAHFFLAFDRQDGSQPLFAGYIQNPADEVSNGVAQDSLARAIDILGRLYFTDTTVPQVGRLERSPTSTTVFTRIDWSLSDRNQLTISNDLSIWDSPLSGGVDQPITLFEGRSDYYTIDQLTGAWLRTTFASGAQNTLRLGFATSKRTLSPASQAPRGFVRIQSRLSDGTNGDTRVQFGGNRLAPDDSRELQLQLQDMFHSQSGNVLWTVGTDNTLTRLDTYIAEAQSGLFEFNSLADLELLRATRYSRTLPLVESQPRTRQHVLELSAFAQAEVRLTPTMTLTGGVRWDGTQFLDKPPGNDLVEDILGESTERSISDWNQVQPRLQLVWDPGGTDRDVFRVGAGKFATQVLYYLQHNQLLNDGNRIADITLTGAAVPFPEYEDYRNDPSTIPGLPAGAPPPAPYVNLVDEAFRMPSVWKASAAWRHRFGERFALTGTLLWTRTYSNYMYVDRNLRDTPAFSLDNEDGRPVFVPAATIDAQGRTLNARALQHPELGRVLQVTSSGEARQHAAIIEATWHGPRQSWVDLSYTYNRAEDNTTYGCCLARTSTTFTGIKGDPRDLTDSWGPSDLDFRHKIVAAVAAPVVWGISVGARYIGANGRPISAVVNGDINGDESSSNDLAFVFDPDDPATAPAVAASMRKVLDNPDNLFRDYLRENLGRIASRNGAFVPWVSRIDVRATKRFDFARGQGVEVGLDIYNFGNILDSDWGAEYQLPLGISNQNPVVQRLPLLNVTGFDKTTNRYVYTVNENFGALTKGGNPFQIQLSLRYLF